MRPTAATEPPRNPTNEVEVPSHEVPSHEVPSHASKYLSVNCMANASLPRDKDRVSSNA